MATDWIQVFKDTPDKPELAVVAEAMKIHKGIAFYYFFRLYSWADGQTADGKLPGMNLRRLAISAGVPVEFCELMASEDIGWLIQSNGSTNDVRFSNWERHNSRNAKRRAMTARRVANHRAKKKP